VLDARSGRLLRTVSGGVAPVAVAFDQRINRAFVVNNGTTRSNGSVNVLDATSGAVLRTVTLGAYPKAVAVDARSGHVFVTSITGKYVSILDASTGTVVRTITMSGSVFTVAVDEQSAQAFVVGMGSSTDSSRRTGSGGLLDRIRTVFPNISSTSSGNDQGTVSVLDTNAFH
jgi:DNA-binding beta-propeller fold protein YncE